MRDHLLSALMGAVSMASFVAMLFFLRFWRQTADTFFLLFAIAFAIDAVARLAIAAIHPTGETEPMFYAARLATFGLIIVAIVGKNRNRRT